MYWFGVKVLYKAEHPEEKVSEELQNESIILVKAENEEEAKEKAIVCCKKEEIEYKNVDDKTVSWKLIEIVDAYEILDEEIKDCVEVYSQLYYKPLDK